MVPKRCYDLTRAFTTILIGISRKGYIETFERHLSYSQLCHVLEHTCTSCVLFFDWKVSTFISDLRSLADDMKSLKSTYLPVVSHVLQRISKTN